MSTSEENAARQLIPDNDNVLSTRNGNYASTYRVTAIDNVIIHCNNQTSTK